MFKSLEDKMKYYRSMEGDFLSFANSSISHMMIILLK